MIPPRRSWHLLSVVTALLAFATACQGPPESGDDVALEEFATRYAAAWSSQDPAAFASFYSDDATFRINDGEPSVGRDAIRETAKGFMDAFPDMVVELVELRKTDTRVEFHWRWTGTNTGPGGTGNAVDLTGFEEWILDGDGQIVESRGHLDEAEYQRQLNADPAGSE